MTYLLIILLHITPPDTAKVDTVKWKYPVIKTVIRDTVKQQQAIDKLDDILNKVKQKKK